MKTDINKINQRIKTELLDYFKNLSFDDVAPLKTFEITKSYTTIFTFLDDIKSKISKYVDVLKSTDPNQIYTDPNDYHITLVPRLNINTDIQTIENTIKSVVRKLDIQFELTHLMPYQLGVALLAFPINFDLNQSS